jgi:hypothetical protein
MLNRTNRTLSANLNRLNLGTRSLAVNASALNGKSTPRILHAHGFAMRVGMFGICDPSMPGIAIPSIPGSTPVVPWPVAGLVVRPPVGDPEALSASRVRPAAAACLAGAAQWRPQARPPQERAAISRRTFMGKRLHPGKAVGGLVRAARTAAAATIAAAGG